MSTFLKLRLPNWLKPSVGEPKSEAFVVLHATSQDKHSGKGLKLFKEWRGWPVLPITKMSDGKTAHTS